MERIIIVLLLLVVTTLTWGQQPDAGRVLEEVKKTPEIQPEKKLPSIDVPPPEVPRWRDPSTRRIPIQGFSIQGNSIYSQEVLLALVKRYEGIKLTLAEIRDLADLITQYYRERGYILARAYLPAQEITEGVIEIAVIEGKIGEVQLKLQEGVRLSKATATRFLSSLKPGDVVNERTLERSLLLLNDLPQVQAKATLIPGKEIGTTDILVEVSQAKLVSASIDADNYGSRFTGKNRFGAAINFNDLSGLGDLLSMRVTTTGSGLNYGRLSYTIPFNGLGSRVGVAYSNVEYELGESFASLNATGDARISSVFLNHPFIRSRGLNLNGQAGLDHKLLEDRVQATDSSTNKIANVGNIGLSLDRRDSFGGGGVNTFGFTYSFGKLNIKTLDVRMADEAGHRTQGGFNKYAFNVSRVQYLAKNWSLYASFSSQLASQNLDSSEKFGIGDAYAVRAYPQGEASGDDGYLVSGEIRWDVFSSSLTDFSVMGFIDSGKVKVNHNPLLTDNNNTRVLSGAGIGFTWSKPNNYVIRFGYAHKLNQKSTDSESAKGRLLLQAYKLF